MKQPASRGSNPRNPRPIFTTTKLGFSFEEQAKKEKTERFRKSRVSESEGLKLELTKSLPNLPKHELEELTTTIRKEYVRRFKRRKTRKYGSLSKAFTESQVQLFFKVIENDKFRLLFSYQAQLGLRIGEVVRVNIKHINFNTRELTLKTEKARTLDTLLIPMQLFKDTMAFISSHKAEI